MQGFAHATIIGNVTRDPEIKYVGEPPIGIANFSIAVNEKTRNGEQTSYYDIKAWRQLADITMKVIRKGSAVVCHSAVRSVL